MFNLTQQERQIVLFLITIALAGMGVNFLGKKYSQIKVIISANQDMGKINLNEAQKEALIMIPGIGEKIAQRIIVYRQEHSSFSDLEELKNIKGITGYKYEKIKEYLTVK